jgi:hypothetical protein
MLASSIAQANKRVALVIGNSAYRYTGELTNPKNDAADMAAALTKLGFQVILGLDLDKGTMERKLQEFARALAGSEAGLLFYAGHGLQVSGMNYLVPIDAKLEDASGIDFELVRLDLVQRTMERETGTNVLFLDACRDNPLAAEPPPSAPKTKPVPETKPATLAMPTAGAYNGAIRRRDGRSGRRRASLLEAGQRSSVSGLRAMSRYGRGSAGAVYHGLAVE